MRSRERWLSAEGRSRGQKFQKKGRQGLLLLQASDDRQQTIEGAHDRIPLTRGHAIRDRVDQGVALTEQLLQILPVHADRGHIPPPSCAVPRLRFSRHAVKGPEPRAGTSSGRALGPLRIWSPPLPERMGVLADAAIWRGPLGPSVP